MGSTIYVYDAHTLEKKFELIGHKKAIHSVAFVQDKIISSSYDGEVKIWDMTGQLEFSTFVNKYLIPPSQTNVDFYGDKMILNFKENPSPYYHVSTLYNFSTKQRLFNLPPDNYVFTNSGKLVGAQNIIPFFSDRQSLVKYVQNVLPRKELTCEERQQYFLPILSRCQTSLAH